MENLFYRGNNWPNLTTLKVDMKIFGAYEIMKALDSATVLWWKIDTFKAHFSFRSLWTRFFYNCLNWLTLTLSKIYHARQRKQKMKYFDELDENNHSLMNKELEKIFGKWTWLVLIFVFWRISGLSERHDHFLVKKRFNKTKHRDWSLWLLFQFQKWSKRIDNISRFQIFRHRDLLMSLFRFLKVTLIFILLQEISRYQSRRWDQSS